LLSNFVFDLLFIYMIDMALVRQKGTLEMNSPTTTGKKPTEAEVKAAQQIVFASNSRVIQPIVEHLIRNHDSVSTEIDTHDLTIMRPTDPHTRDTLTVTLASGNQSINLIINNFNPNKVYRTVTADLKTLQPPNPKLISNLEEGNLVPASVELNEDDAYKLEQVIRSALVRQRIKEQKSEDLQPQARSFMPSLVRNFFQRNKRSI
jgi:hypothetical protein